MLVRAGRTLPEPHRESLVSGYRLKQAEGIALVRTSRACRRQSLLFTSRPFVLCELPVRRPPEDHLLFERRNRHFLFKAIGHPRFGLPFGQGRLVRISLSTLVVRQGNPSVRSRFAAEMLDTFGIAMGGKEYRRIVSASKRIFGASKYFRPRPRALRRLFCTVVTATFPGKLRPGTAALES